MGLSARSVASAAACLSLAGFVLAIDSVSFDSTPYQANSDTSPYQTFKSSPRVEPPELLIYANTSSRIMDGYVLIGVDGKPSSGSRSPIIYNMSPGENIGTVVWAGFEYSETFDVEIQTYKNQPVISFWQGQMLDGFGCGSYHIISQNYSELAHVQPVGSEDAGDIHEFRITDDNTALLTIYWVKNADLTPFNGSSDGYIYECSFHEINIETGELIFIWNASDHTALNQTYNEFGNAGTEETPFDWFHINSIQKNADGNYLISSRCLWTVFKINGQNGQIMWRLNGKSSDFKVDAQADFHCQHHARWFDTSTRTQLSLFANMGEEDSTYSRGVLMSTDEDAKTADLITLFHNTDQTWSKYEGDLQCLNCADSDTNWFLGFGNQPYFTELTSDGTVVSDVQFAVNNVINSYRAFKFPLSSWVGKPLTNPNISWDTSEEKVYMSWNGATEVAKWEVYTAYSTNSTRWTLLGSAAKVGFETVIDVASFRKLSTYVRGKALNSNGDKLGYTDATDGTSFYEVSGETQVASTSTASATVSAASATSTSEKKSSGLSLASTSPASLVILVGMVIALFV
ncbi:hypothetical protein VP1G_03823 [Cytospora mali]|uniref:ASST-domain-containing protein n=1 Tax=Cytospora mali TaxID=578113 RepID=A0A194UXM4_CYTMA|nr:hypothetical protein VP1G_03823 [Valsa mali var. pyri (nom. inval.)]